MVAGLYVDGTLTDHSYLRYPDGALTTFDAPGAGTTPDNFFGTFAVANNDLGVVSGYTIDDNNVSHGFIRSPDGRIGIFNVQSAGKSSGQGTTPFGLNLWGAIPGVFTDTNNINHGFVRDPGVCEAPNG